MSMSDIWRRPVASTIVSYLKDRWQEDAKDLVKNQRTGIQRNGLDRPPIGVARRLAKRDLISDSSAREPLIDFSTRFARRRMFAAAESCLRDAMRQAEIEVQMSEQLVEDVATAVQLSVLTRDDLRNACIYRDKAKGGRADVFNELGYVQTLLARYAEAKSSYEDAIRDYNGLAYGTDNLGGLYWWSGSYEAARTQWTEARRLYRNSESIAESEGWAGHFFFEGHLLFDTFGEIDEAEQAYRKGIELDPDTCFGYLGLMKILLERADAAASRSRAESWAIREIYEQGIESITRTLAASADLDAVITIGEMHLLMRKDAAAEEVFRAAYQFNEWCTKEMPGYLQWAAPAANLAVLITRRAKDQEPSAAIGDVLMPEQQARYREALGLFEEALAIVGDDLMVASNRAETLLRLGRFAEAEREYLAILKQAPGHIDSLVGMAEVYLEYGKGGDCAMLEQAISTLDCVINLAARKGGSKRLTKAEEASIHSLRGYARVQQAIAERGATVPWLTHRAYIDYRYAARLNPDLHSARHSAARLKALFGANTGYRFIESLLPFLVGLIGVLLILFCVALVFDWWGIRILAVTSIPAGVKEETLPHRPIILSPLEFISAITAAVAMIVVGVYLPRIMKLKFAGVEIEKSVVDNIDTVNLMTIDRVSKK